MRKFLVIVTTFLILFLAACKKEEKKPEQVEPLKKGVPFVGFSLRSVAPPPADHKLVHVRMQIIGMTILNTKADNAVFTLFIPEVMSHEPFIYANVIYGMKRPPGATTRIPVKETSISGTDYHVLLLNDEDLSLTPDPNEALSYTIGSGRCPFTVDDLETLQWAPSLSDALDKTANVDSKYTRPSPEKVGLHARMKIEHGYVYAQPTEWYVWQFRDDPAGTTGHKQMLTPQVIQEFSVYLPDADPVLHVKTQPFGGALEELVALSPVMLPDGTGKIVFTIGITDRKERLPGSGTNSDEDTHYPEYYKILDPSIFPKDANGKPILPTIRPFKVKDEYCKQPTNTLVNCGPGRP